MKKRLKEVRELIAEKEGRLDAIEAKCSKEQRAWNDEEKEEVRTLGEEISDLVDEKQLLEQEEQRQKIKAARKAAEDQDDEEKRNAALKDKDKNKDAKVTARNLKDEEARNAKVFKLIQGFVNRDTEAENEARKSLVEGGHYDDFFEGKEQRNFSTLKDGKGGIMLPTTISQTVFDIEQEYGFIPQHTLSLGDIGNGDIVVPNVLSRPSFYAVNEKGTIQGSGLNLGGIRLKALKWGSIIDWTNEVDESVGSRLLPIVLRKVSEALAFEKDNVFFNGDGSSTYNGIKGLETLVGNENYVRQATAASGNTSFATLDAEDFLAPVENVTPGKRSGGRFIMHPNMIFTLMKLKDGQGEFIYGKPSEVNPVGTLWGYPISTSEAFAYTDGTSKTVCAFVNPSSIAYGNGRNLTTTRLDQATITNEDSTTVNLATQDAQALRFTARFDIKLDNNTRTTAGTAEGAFSVLRTAAA